MNYTYLCQALSVVQSFFPFFWRKMILFIFFGLRDLFVTRRQSRAAVPDAGRMHAVPVINGIISSVPIDVVGAVIPAGLAGLFLIWIQFYHLFNRF